MIPASTSTTGDQPATAAWEASPVSRRGLILFAVAVCLVSLWYSHYTEQIWEDALITLRHSDNWLQGDGLVYNPGERVHGFTSPVNVLLLTLCRVIGGADAPTFWLYRIFTIAAYAGGGVLLLSALANVAPRWTPALWFLAVAYTFDSKSVAFATNGMETGFMMLFVGWAIYLLTTGPVDRWLARGLCWTGLMWTRPDGCVYIVVLAIMELTFLRHGPRRAVLVSLARSAGLCAVLYSPWVVWTWWYYGSPIPHTVVAKANVEFGPVAQFFKMLDDLLSNIVKFGAKAFRPIHFGENNNWLPSVGWTRVINGLTKAVAVFALFYWVYPSRDRFGRACSLSFMLLCVYFSYLSIVYPWYYPPVMMFGLLALVRGMSWLVVEVGARHVAPSAFRSPRRLSIAVLCVLAVGQFGVFSIAAQEEQIRQAVVEDECRAKVGTWIKEHGKPGESIYLEPLGYIGYYSGMRMLDFPGLVSPEIVRIRREEADEELSFNYGRVLIIPRLTAEWIVLRITEYEVLQKTDAFADFKKKYRAVKVISAFDKLNEYRFLPGEDSLRFDSSFVIFRRNDTPALPALPALPPEK